MTTLDAGAIVRVRDDGAAARLTLDRLEQRAVLSIALLLELVAVLRRVSAESGVRAIVIEGGRAGVLGRARPRRDDRPRRAVLRWLFDVCMELIGKIHRLPEPVIARVERTATGAGCRLVACDLLVAAESAWFGTPGVKIGLFCSTPMVALSRAIGRKRGLDMLVTGRVIDAATALDWGFVNRIVPAGAAEERSRCSCRRSRARARLRSGSARRRSARRSSWTCTARTSSRRR